MNISRRKFINVGTLSLGISALPICNFLKKKTELEDLYDYMESHTVLHPLKGEVPFKLYPHHKRILKNIHENDKVVIVKARQIGMTTLLAGYMRWRYGLYNYRYFSGSFERNNHFENKIAKFSNVKIPDNSICCVCDEYNLFKIPIIPEGVKKVIITGTPDYNGNLKYIVDRKDLFGFKVFTYSAHDCYPMWDKNKIDLVKNVYYKHMNDNYFKRDLEAKFV